VAVVNEQVLPITSWRDGFRRTPVGWRVAVLVGVLGWFLTLGGSTTRTVNGVSDCDGFDLGPLLVAAVVAALALVGWRRARQGHPATRLPDRWARIGLSVLGALVLVHVLRTVIEPAGGMC
jgi:hypothetical protein